MCADAAATENVFISPLSVASALAMAAAGATAASKVEAAFLATLHGDLAFNSGANLLRALATPSDASVTLNVANSLWARQVKPSYAALLSQRFNATAQPLTDAQAVNGWVSARTQGRITSIVDDGVVQNPLTIALLVNAVFFKAPWSKPFDSARTMRGLFKVHAAGNGIPCAMMSLKVSQLHYAASEAGQAVALPYGDGQFRALLVLPAVHAPESLGALTSSNEAVQALRAALQPQRLLLSMPRFTLQYGVASLKAALSAMGLEPAFVARAGDFTGISDNPDVHVSDVLHKALLEVTEEGTVAAAATAVVMATRMIAVQPPPVVLTFDRPFLMVIEDAQTGAPLFMGRVVHPVFTAVPEA